MSASHHLRIAHAKPSGMKLDCLLPPPQACCRYTLNCSRLPASSSERRGFGMLVEPAPACLGGPHLSVVGSFGYCVSDLTFYKANSTPASCIRAFLAFNPASDSQRVCFIFSFPTQTTLAHSWVSPSHQWSFNLETLTLH